MSLFGIFGKKFHYFHYFGDYSSGFFSDPGLVKSVKLKESENSVWMFGRDHRRFRPFYCDVDIRSRSCAIYIRFVTKPCDVIAALSLLYQPISVEKIMATWLLFWNFATMKRDGKLKNKYCFNLFFFYRMIIIDDIVRFLIKRSILRRILHGIWHANDLESWPKISVSEIPDDPGCYF